jgi:hypothetical protein
MNILVAISLISSLIAFVLLLRTFSCARRGRLLRAGGAGISCLGCAAVSGVALLLAFSYYSYGRLTSEKVISSLQFRQTASDEYEARLMISGERDRLFRLRGNEWQLDARLISWKPPVTILGLDPIYRLERLSGRFSEIDRERIETRTVHALSPDSYLDIWTVARRFPLLAPGVDAHYGSATYVPMSDGARFDVSLSRDAVIARPVNDAAREAVGRWGTAGE